jgi:hypothetical protein
MPTKYKAKQTCATIVLGGDCHGVMARECRTRYTTETNPRALLTFGNTSVEILTPDTLQTLREAL